MTSLSNVSSAANPNTYSIKSASTVFDRFPIEVLERIASFLNFEGVVPFGLAHRNLTCLFSYRPLWDRFLHREFPDSYAKIKSDAKDPSFYETKSLALYNKYTPLANVVRNMKAGTVSLLELNEHQDQVTCITVYDNKLISGSKDNTIKIWDLEKGQEVWTLQGHAEMVKCILVCGDQLISGSWDEMIKIWDLKTGKEIITLAGHQDMITSIIPYEDQFISGSRDGGIKIWDLEARQEVQTLKGHEKVVSCMTTYKGNLISASWDKTIKIWDLGTGKEVRTLEGHEGVVKCILVCGDKLISGSWDKTIKIWDLKTGEEILTLKGHYNSINGILVCDGKLISGSADGTIKIWDLETGEEILTLNRDALYGEPVGIICITVCNDKLISGLSDGTIKIWDLKTGEELHTLNGHQKIVSNIISGDGKFISCSWDNTIKIWDFNAPSLLVHSKQLLEENKNKPAEELPLLLVNLGIETEKDCLEKLNCRPRDVVERGISSPEDLQALFNSSNLQYLEIIPEEVTEDRRQLQTRAFDKQKIVSTLLDELLVAARQKSEETLQCSVLRKDSGDVYEGVNPWTDFLKKLNSAQAALNTQGLTRDQLLQKFSPESYAELVKEVNTLIDEFRTLEHGVQILRLRAYLTQWGILKLWTGLHSQGIHNLSALLEKEDAPRDIFRMGI